MEVPQEFEPLTAQHLRETIPTLESHVTFRAYITGFRSCNRTQYSGLDASLVNPDMKLNVAHLLPRSAVTSARKSSISLSQP